MEGVLKQQVLDRYGLYSWCKKVCRLTIGEGLLHIIDEDECDENQSTASINLKDAIEAKEWAFSSDLTGFGFDLRTNIGI